MKPNFAIICDNAFIDENGRLNIIQIFDTIHVDNLPAIHPRLTVVTNYKIEKRKEYSQQITIQHKDTGQVIASTEEQKLTPSTNAKNIQFIAYFIGTKFDQTGTYTAEVKLDQEKKASLTLFVKAPTNGQKS